MGKEIPMESNDLPGKSLLRPDEVAAFMRVCVKTVRKFMGIEPTYQFLAGTLDLKSRRPTRRLGTSTH